ncbi:MAG: pantoate--beta-alanine ligase [Chitinophagaceae bacterium]
MIIFKEAAALASYLQNPENQQKTVGFVPTMGALHQGHLALIAQAHSQTDIVICSIFVNPTQFNDPADYQKYPNTIPKDVEQLTEAGTQVLFLPSVQEMYPAGTAQLEHYDLGYLETVLEGAFRPGHFQGVCQVMSRLLTMVKPHKLFMGQKDYQQCMVVQRLLQLMPLDTQLVICPTIREQSGLAMSSRNMRLSEEERSIALAIYRALSLIKQQLQPGPLATLKQQATSQLQQDGFKVDYVEIATANNLTLVSEWDGKQPLVALVAAFLNEVRLIDNMIIT